MLTGFYGAFSPACLALLGLWLVVVQVRMREWQGSAIHRRRSYGVALTFALPGVMSLFALIDPQDPDYWRVSFAIIALGGAVALAAVRGFPVRRERTAAGTAGFPVPDQLGLAAYIAGIALFALIGALAFAGRAGHPARRGSAADRRGIPRVQRRVAAAIRRYRSIPRPLSCHQ